MLRCVGLARSVVACESLSLVFRGFGGGLGGLVGWRDGGLIDGEQVFVNDFALVVYVYLTDNESDAVITVRTLPPSSFPLPPFLQ